MQQYRIMQYVVEAYNECYHIDMTIFNKQKINQMIVTIHIRLVTFTITTKRKTATF